MWTRGGQIVLRYSWQGQLSWVEPVTVVEDPPELMALYLAIDTPIKRLVGQDGLPIPRFQSYESLDPCPGRSGMGGRLSIPSSGWCDLGRRTPSGCSGGERNVSSSAGTATCRPR